MPKTLSDEQMQRIKELFRQVLGRDLSAEEQKYLSLSSTVVSIGELELKEPESETPKLKLVNED